MVHKGALITVVGMIISVVALATFYSSGGSLGSADTVSNETVTKKIPDSYFLMWDCYPVMGNSEGEATYWNCPKYGTEAVYNSYLKDHPELTALE